MRKLYSQLVGLPIVEDSSPAAIASVQDVILDPETGKILAFLSRKNHIIVPMDVEKINSVLTISDREHMLHIDDVLRVKEVVKRNISLIGSRVFAERTRIYLGRVVDYEVDTTTMSLLQIHTAKIFFFFHSKERIFSFKQIVKIERDRVIVKDIKEAKVKEKADIASARSEAFA